MFRFRSFQNAARFALRCRQPAMVYDGLEEDYVVALVAEARRLEVDGHEPYTISETAQASGARTVEGR